nr:uncharacterized protein LOC105885341 [Microcebus murinus]
MAGRPTGLQGSRQGEEGGSARKGKSDSERELSPWQKAVGPPPHPACPTPPESHPAAANSISHEDRSVGDLLGVPHVHLDLDNPWSPDTRGSAERVQVRLAHDRRQLKNHEEHARPEHRPTPSTDTAPPSPPKKRHCSRPHFTGEETEAPGDCWFLEGSECPDAVPRHTLHTQGPALGRQARGKHEESMNERQIQLRCRQHL